MARDFFGNLGDTITKTAREIGGRAENAYETQKIRSKISSEQRQADKTMTELGRIIYRRYKEGVPVDDAQRALCEQITQHMERMEELKGSLKKVKTRRVCPSCGKPIGKDAAFCSYCGAACPVQEKEEEAGNAIEETMEEVTEDVLETAEKAATVVSESVEEASEKAVEMAGKALHAAEDAVKEAKETVTEKMEKGGEETSEEAPAEASDQDPEKESE